MAYRAAWPVLLLVAGCGPSVKPPPSVWFGGLPASGSHADARRAGFTACVQADWFSLRCRRHGVMIAGTGPYEAAVDLAGHDGSGGFDQVTLWHDGDQYAVYAITDALERRGWQSCNTGDGERGDQIIYTLAGTHVRVSMDLSYWGKRRLRVIPEWNRKERRCRASGPVRSPPA